MRFIRLRIVIHFENVLDFSFWLFSLFRQKPGPHTNHWCPLRHTLAEVLNIQISHNSESSQSSTDLMFPWKAGPPWTNYLSGKFMVSLWNLYCSTVQDDFEGFMSIVNSRSMFPSLFEKVSARSGPKFVLDANVFFSNRWSVGEMEIIIPSIFHF